MKLSVVVSVYNEEQVLDLFYQEISNVLNKCSFQYELIFVNDGSIDKTQKILESLHNPNVRIITFSRNFGHEAAMIAGIDYAKGDAVLCMDGDLQHPPRLIPEIIERFENDSLDIINMSRNEHRANNFSNFFYRILNKLSSYKLEPNASDFFLISKRVADVLRDNYRERVRFLRGYVQIIGFKKGTFKFSVEARKGGSSKYSMIKLFGLSVTAIATLSKAPLKLGIYAGLISGLFSFLLAIFSIVMRVIGQPVSGYTTIIVFLGFMFSIQFIILGILGEYIGFLFDEQKKRPIYIVDKIIDLEVNEKI